MIKIFIFILIFTSVTLVPNIQINEKDSNILFNRIHKSSVTVTSPTSSSTWERGKSYFITWSATGVSYVKIELYKGGSPYSTISSKNSDDGSYEWSISSSHTTGTDYQIKISDYYNSSDYDYSATYFEIEEETSLDVNVPSSSSYYFPSSSMSIDWDSIGSIPSVKIELYSSSTLIETITASTSDDGSYDWTVPETYLLGGSYRIKITDTSDSDTYDYGNTFKILPSPLITGLIAILGIIAIIGTIAICTILISRKGKRMVNSTVKKKNVETKIVEQKEEKFKFCEKCGGILINSFCAKCDS